LIYSTLDEKWWPLSPPRRLGATRRYRSEHACAVNVVRGALQSTELAIRYKRFRLEWRPRVARSFHHQCLADAARSSGKRRGPSSWRLRSAKPTLAAASCSRRRATSLNPLPSRGCSSGNHRASCMHNIGAYTMHGRRSCVWQVHAQADELISSAATTRRQVANAARPRRRSEFA
jgi:hypothetical protein